MLIKYRPLVYEFDAMKFTGTKESFDKLINFVEDYGNVHVLVPGDPLFNEPEVVMVQYDSSKSYVDPSWIIHVGDYIYIDRENRVIVSSEKDFFNKFEEVK